eukprot:2241257-Amphidinium_carterae.1
MVTLNLSPKDPRFQSEEARKALKNEMDGLLSAGVWRWEDCEEFSEVKRRHPHHHHARLFPLIGIKHWENPAMRRYKGRIVLGGHAIHTATHHVEFQEAGITP